MAHLLPGEGSIVDILEDPNDFHWKVRVAGARVLQDDITRGRRPS